MKKFYHFIPQNHFYVLTMKSKQIDTNEVSNNNVWFKCIDGVDWNASITEEHRCLIRSCQEIQSKWLYASYFCSSGETNYPSAFELWASARVHARASRITVSIIRQLIPGNYCLDWFTYPTCLTTRSSVQSALASDFE